MAYTDRFITDQERPPALELERIVHDHEAELLRYAAGILRNPEAAQDVVQDAFIKLCKRCRAGKALPGQLRGWLFRIVHNQAVDHIRRESRLKLLHQKQAAEGAGVYTARQRQEVQHREAMALALDYVGELKPAEQQVILLRLQQNLSYREISAITKRTEGNIGCILHHAIKKLAARLKEAGAF